MLGSSRSGVPNLFVSVSPLTTIASPHWYKCTQDITDLRPLVSPRLGTPGLDGFGNVVCRWDWMKKSADQEQSPKSKSNKIFFSSTVDPIFVVFRSARFRTFFVENCKVFKHGGNKIIRLQFPLRWKRLSSVDVLAPERIVSHWNRPGPRPDVPGNHWK